jgi:hypothetical protein
MILGGVIVIALVVVLALKLLGGSSTPQPSASTSSTGTTTTTAAKHAKAHTPTTAKFTAPANAAETSVAVLNGTETTGLAHRVSGQLQQLGYSQATALNGHPAGAAQTTVVEYTSGHRGDAESVARALGSSNVQPMEASVAPLAGTASVAVLVGADKASAG